MNHAHENRVNGALGAGLAIVAPDGKEGMLQHARECAAHGIPFLFDPGQGLPMFSAEELAEFVRLADYVAVNDYEGKMLEEKTGRALADLARDVKALIVTLGGQGLAHPCGGRAARDPRAAAEAGGGSHRLRRCLPRRTAVRHRPRLGLAPHRAAWAR
jgi:adenosine kinase